MNQGKKRSFTITKAESGAAFPIRVVTRAQRNEIVGAQDDGTLKIRLTASPSDGQADNALIKFLAERLGIPESKIEMVAGRDKPGTVKMITVQGVSTADAEEMLQPDPDVSDN
jgi:uncharacterized protein YggU (UPF0235/DUF167 family)